MTIETRIIALAQAVGADVKTLTGAIGALSGLTTTSKASLVSAINEVRAVAAAAGGGSSGSTINDGVGAGATTETWSANKIFTAIESAKAAVKSDLINGAGAALDTLAELAAALGNDANFATTIATQIANRVRFDAAQTLTTPQKTQVLANIGAASSADYTALSGTVSGLTTGLGSYDRNYVADYTAAKA